MVVSSTKAKRLHREQHLCFFRTRRRGANDSLAEGNPPPTPFFRFTACGGTAVLCTRREAATTTAPPTATTTKHCCCCRAATATLRQGVRAGSAQRALATVPTDETFFPPHPVRNKNKKQEEE